MTDNELKEFQGNIDPVSRPLTSTETFAYKLVDAHLGNDSPPKKAEAVNALRVNGQAEQNTAIDMYLSAMNYKTMDGIYNEQEAQVMNAVVRNLAYKLINHQPLQEIPQVQQAQYQR